MKKSLPVSDNLETYFTDPCPVLSDNNVHLILDEIQKGYDWVVEYGMGASTLYILQNLRETKINLVSVENNIDWFDICVDQVQRKTDLKEILRKREPWTLRQIAAFVNGQSQCDIPQDLSRFHRWKESLSLGPFFRLSPESKSRFSGKLGPLWSFAKPVLKLLAHGYYLISAKSRPCNAEWIGKNEHQSLTLRNVGPSIKDQYGEAPNMKDYINAGLEDALIAITQGKAVSALVIIDGGPRHKIVEEVLNLENQYPNFKPTIILCDASRVFYYPVLEKRPSGRFVAGSGLTLKGGPVANDVSGDMAKFWVGGDKSAQELAQQEVWIYRSASR